MTGPKLNERPGTRATLRGYHMSASKARVVLNLIRGEDITTAREILAGTNREAADVIGKVLASAVANAVTNDAMQADELFVSAAFADEGVTMKRFTPRARGRAGKIMKHSCHITVIVSRLDDERLETLRNARSAQAAVSRTRRVASSRRRADQQASLNKRETAAVEAAENEALEAEANANATAYDEAYETDTSEFDTVDTPVEDLQTDVLETNETDGAGVAEVSVDESPVEETPAEETPAEETPADEVPEEVVAEAPTDDSATDDTTEETK
jgi:large subunit ribosomal protein L22